MTLSFEKSNYDAIIILANEMDINGVLNHESKARANLAFEIFDLMNIPFFITCGWSYRRDSSINIADAFKSYLIKEFNVDPDIIKTEINSRDTVGDAYFTKVNLLNPLNWRRVCVVTSSYHADRTREIFKFILGNSFIVDVYGVDVIYDENILVKEATSLNVFKRTFSGVSAGNDSEILKRLKVDHPFYNGEVYKKFSV